MGHLSSFYSKLASHQLDKVPTVTPLKEKLERSVPGSQSRLPRAGLVMHAFFLSELSSLSDGMGASEPCFNLSRSEMPRCTMMHQMALDSPGFSMS